MLSFFLCVVVCCHSFVCHFIFISSVINKHSIDRVSKSSKERKKKKQYDSMSVDPHVMLHTIECRWAPTLKSSCCRCCTTCFSYQYLIKWWHLCPLSHRYTRHNYNTFVFKMCSLVTFSRPNQWSREWRIVRTIHVNFLHLCICFMFILLATTTAGKLDQIFFPTFHSFVPSFIIIIIIIIIIIVISPIFFLAICHLVLWTCGTHQ